MRILDVIFIMGSIFFIIFIVNALIKGLKENPDADIIFESRVDPNYKILNITGAIWTLFLAVFIVKFAREIITGGDYRQSIFLIFMGLYFIILSLESPKKLVLTNKKIYYIMRFGGRKDICSYNCLISYKIIKKGKVRLKLRDRKRDLDLMIKLTDEELVEFNQIMEERKIMEENKGH